MGYAKGWYWLSVGVLALGLNAEYQRGGLDRIHRAADRSLAGVQRVAGQARQYVALAELLLGHERAPAAPLQVSVAHTQATCTRQRLSPPSLGDDGSVIEFSNIEVEIPAAAREARAVRLPRPALVAYRNITRAQVAEMRQALQARRADLAFDSANFEASFAGLRRVQAEAIATAARRQARHDLLRVHRVLRHAQPEVILQQPCDGSSSVIAVEPAPIAAIQPPLSDDLLEQGSL